MAYSVVSALVGALILSLTLVPLLCSVMLKKNLPEKENFIVLAAKRWYEPALAWALGQQEDRARHRGRLARRQPRAGAAASAASSCPS